MAHNYAQAYVGNSLLRPADVRPVPFGEQDDTPIGIIIRYIGTDVSGIIVVAADGNLTFKSGALGAEANDVSIGGAADAGATIDVSEATEDTFGEVLDLINADANWEAVLVDVVRSTTATDALLANAGQQMKVTKGFGFVLDTTTALVTGRLIAPDAYRKDIRTYERQGAVNSAFPFTGHRAALIRALEVTTYAADTSFWKLYSEDALLGDVNTIWDVAAGATTVEDEIDFSMGEQVSNQAERLVLMVENASSMSATKLVGQGVFYRSLN